MGGIGVVELDQIADLDALRSRFIELGVFIRPIGNVIYLDACLHDLDGRARDADRRGGQSCSGTKTFEEGCMTYSGPAIDTHHHIWLRKDVGWLADPPVPRMFGDYFGFAATIRSKNSSRT